MSIFNTELATEILFFSVDAIFSIYLLKKYTMVHRFINNLEEIRDGGDPNVLDDNSSDASKYVMICGPVKALKDKIKSMYVPNITGVVQKLTTSELIMKRTSCGIWWDDTRPILKSYNIVPFAIVHKGNTIKVQDVLLADELHLDNVYSKYDRTVQTLAGSVWGYFFGMQQFGMQTTEEMLKEGTIVTGIGDLIKLSDGSRMLIPPSGNKPYYITTQSLLSLLRDLRDKRIFYGSFLLVTGGLTIFFGSLLARRMWISFKKRRAKREMQRRLDTGRRLRRQNLRDNNIPELLRCVVCQDKPKEVIMLPCGHLCVCEDCSDRLNTTCPICRSHIVTKAAAFF